jgi:glycosyltransferase involved in cell wall biosynthesis
MKISFIIPTRNSSLLLDICLAGFIPLNETVEQIIIVDCCSTDGIEVVLAKYKCLPIVHIREQDKGIYDAFNKGVSAATAPLVFFLGADDTINGEIFNAVREFNIKYDIIVGEITKGKRVERWRPWIWGGHLLIRNIPHQSMLIKREILIKKPYTLKYKILSDYAWNISNYWSNTVKYSFCSRTYCNWDQYGLSNLQIDEVFKIDKQKLIEKNAPYLIRIIYYWIKYPKDFLLKVMINKFKSR